LDRYSEVSTTGLSYLIKLKPEVLRALAVARSRRRLTVEGGAALRALPEAERRLAAAAAARRLEWAMQEHTRLSRWGAVQVEVSCTHSSKAHGFKP
jgi:hypothetical protein